MERQSNWKIEIQTCTEKHITSEYIVNPATKQYLPKKHGNILQQPSTKVWQLSNKNLKITRKKISLSNNHDLFWFVNMDTSTSRRKFLPGSEAWRSKLGCDLSTTGLVEDDGGVSIGESWRRILGGWRKYRKWKAIYVLVFYMYMDVYGCDVLLNATYQCLFCLNEKQNTETSHGYLTSPLKFFSTLSFGKSSFRSPIFVEGKHINPHDSGNVTNGFQRLEIILCCMKMYENVNQRRSFHEEALISNVPASHIYLRRYFGVVGFNLYSKNTEEE